MLARSVPVLLVACTSFNGQEPDTGADTGAPDDTAVVDTDTAVDTDTDTGPAPLPDRLASRRYKQVFVDEFDGGVRGDPCYDAARTPPMCLDRYWSRTQCGAAEVAHLKGLNFCVWSAYDIYNWMDWGKPLGGINNLDPLEVSVHDGSLWLEAHRVEGDGVYDCGHDLPDYYVSNDCPIRSGAVMSRPWEGTAGFAQTYGRFEVRAVLPRGGGSWPAHWMLPVDGDWPAAGEIDIMEAIAAEPTVTTGNYHGGKWDGGTHIHQGAYTRHDTHDERFLDEVHTYAVEWEPGQIRYFVDDIEFGHLDDGTLLAGDVLSSTDGVPQGSYVDPFPVALPSTPFFFILNTSVVPTGRFDLDTFGPLVHRIDSVRAFVRCEPDDPDPGCEVRGDGTADVTEHAGMSVEGWSAARRHPHLGDFDGDGVTDLLLRGLSRGDATVLVRGDGVGGFVPSVTLDDCCGTTREGWTVAVRGAAVGDFDGDGDDDLVLPGVGPATPTLWLRADGDGGFAPAVDVSAKFGMTGARWDASTHAPRVADFDGDGADDLLLAGKGDEDETLLLVADGAGGFRDAVALTWLDGLTAADWAGAEVIVGDFDGSGGADILVRGEATWLLRRDGGGFAVADVTSRFGMTAADWSRDSRVAHVGDFDGDGRLDLLLQGRGGTDRTLWLRGAGDGFEEPENLGFASGMSHAKWAALARAAHVGDFDGDGADDVLLQPLDDRVGPTLLLRADRAGGFLEVEDVTELATFAPFHWAADRREILVADYDGDGADDLLLRGLDAEEKSYVVYVP